MPRNHPATTPNPAAAKVAYDYTMLDTERALDDWAEKAHDYAWIAFDTEFIGEKRFRTLVCLIQVACPDGLFLIDPMAIDDLGGFLDLIEDDSVLKITHAGENDYRLLYQNFGCEPRNLLDTQLASGFLSERYPVNFKSLVQTHLGVEISKGYAVADWSRRPIQKGALKYALEDVVYLRDMLDVVTEKLKAQGRYDWFVEEMGNWEDVRRYEKTLLDEVKGFGAVYKMRRNEKLFLMRMIEWRRDIAEERNHSREMVLATKDLNAIVRAMRNGRNGFTSNRHLNKKSWMRHFEEWEGMYQREASPQEIEDIKELAAPKSNDLREEIVIEILYRYLRYHCLQHEIAVDLVLPRSVIRELNTGNKEALNELMETWRKEFLGDEVMELLRNTAGVEPVLEGRSLVFRGV